MAEPAVSLDERPVAARRPLQRRSARRIAARLVVDAMAVSSAMFISSILYFELELFGERLPAAKADYAVLTFAMTPVWLVIFWLYDLYEPRQVLSPVSEFKQIVQAIVAGIVVIFLADSLFDQELARGWILLTIVTTFVVVGAERLAIRKMLHFLRRRGAESSPTIVVGTNHEARTVVKTLSREAWLGYDIIGFVDDDVTIGQEIEGRPVLGHTTDLPKIVAEHGAALVLIAATALETARLNRLLWELQNQDVDLQITSGTIDLMASRMTVQSVAGVPLLFVRRTGINRAQLALKRSLDVLGSTIGLVLLSPAFLIFAVWIRKDSAGPVFFKQVRIGRDGHAFTCWKFRTMVADAEEKRRELEHLSEGPGLLFKLKDDPRVTRSGRFLRRYSLDELPQLYNVVKGEMSLVGPRPALPSEVEQYDDWVRNRLRVKPGMTGLWQVSGRTETSFADYVRYDLFYIQNWSLSLDLWILWRTFRAVFSAEGAH
ncbi:MAG: sugar transferase [Actinomycetota bacterium]|nr:sugar transferase [Actinomycetota bacterium]